MREFGANIAIDGGNGPTAGPYEADVNACLVQLMAFRTGNAVIKEIWSNKLRRVRITPWTASQVNADVQPGRWVDAFQGMEPVRTSGGRPTSGFGTGAGSDTLVRFSPQQFQHNCSYRGITGNVANLGGAVAAGADRNSTLLHELVHVTRFLRGTARRRALAPVSGGTGGIASGLPSQLQDEEELIAVTITNIYASERGIALRSDHASMTAELQNADFWREPSIHAALSDFLRSMPGLGGALAAIDTSFNPLRQIAQGARASLRLRDWQGRVVDPYRRPL